MRLGATLRSLQSRGWIWSFAAAAVIWAVIAAKASSSGAGDTMVAALSFGTFYVIVGLGEMLVVTVGPGNIDLSIPSVMTLAGYLSMGVMRSQDGRLWLGFLTAVGVGAAAGLANVVLIRGVRIPPMIATMAAGFVMQSITIAYSKSSTAKPTPLLVELSEARVLGLPLLALAVIILAVGTAFVLSRSVFGRSVLAIGQSARAAYLAGISVRRTVAAVYIISAVFAALAGFFLSAYSGGASLDMSTDFLLMAIAVVVLGGTSIAGGHASVAGLWGASLFLYLTIALLNVLGVSIGLRYVVTGLTIVVVLALSKPLDKG